MKMLRLTAVDFGVGIPGNVRAFRGDQSIAAHLAMNWAFQRGTTTRPGSAGGGIGLDLLKELVRLNGGALSVFSHEGYAVLFSQAERYLTRATYFEGTMVTITLRCDQAHYCLASEPTSQLVF
jgi:signal transduction histidine kinase